MKQFIAKYADKITGVVHGFDRLVFKGTLRSVAFVDGLKRLLFKNGVLLKDFGAYAQAITQRLKEASLKKATDLGRSVVYLPFSETDKEKIARDIAKRDKISKGPITVLTCVEPCRSYDIYNRPRKLQTR